MCDRGSVYRMCGTHGGGGARVAGGVREENRSLKRAVHILLE